MERKIMRRINKMKVIEDAKAHAKNTLIVKVHA